MGSVHNEISRLETAKSDIEAAIEACGVPVPDTDLISTYATYIRQIPSAVFSGLNYDQVGGGDTYIKTIKQTNGLIEATTGGLVSTSQSGLTPKIENAATAIATQADEWVLTSNKGAIPTWKKLPANAFKNDNNNTTYSLSGGLSGNNYIVTLTDSSSTPVKTTATVPKMTGATSSVDGDAGLVPAPTKANVNQYLKGDGTWATPTNTTYSVFTGATSSANGTSGLVPAPSKGEETQFLRGDGNWVALPTDYYSSTAERTANTVLAAPNGSNGIASFRKLVAADIPNLASNKITALTGYSKATSASAISTTNSLNTALGKLEYKADLGKSAYDIVSAAYDGNGTVENLAEILKVLEGIKDTETIQAIVGKYLPLTGGTLTGNLTAPKFIGALQGNATTATSATSLSSFDAASSTTTKRYVWMSYDDNSAKPAYTDKLTFQTSTGTLFTGKLSVTGAITSSLTTSSHLAGNRGTAIINSTAAAGYTMLAKMNSTNGVFTIGAYRDSFNLYYTANTTITAGTNACTKTVYLLDESGNTGFAGNVTASKFIKSGGTSSQFLKADGSVDSNTYLTSLPSHNHDSTYVKWAKVAKSEVDKTTYNPYIFNVENENLVANFYNYWHVLNFGSYSGGGFRTQMAMPYQNDLADSELFIRSAKGSTWRDWRRVLHAGNTYINSGTITINGSSITPLTSHQSLSNYVTLNGAQTITGAKTFSKALNISGLSSGDAGLIITGSSYKIGFMIGSGNVNRGIYDYTNNNWTFYCDGSDAYITNWASKGSATNPVYFNANGKPVACTYSLNKTVPSNAVFTDTASGKTFKTLTDDSHSGWTNNTTDDKIIPTMSFIAYWNGAYNSSGASNLAYCNKGAFGSIVTKSDSDYAAASHNHSASDITSGTLAVARGGTGKTTLADAANALINALTAGSSNPTDSDYYVCQYAGGGTTTTTYHRRPHSALYKYLKGKFDSVYATAHSHSYLPLAGGTLTGNLVFNKTTPYIYFNTSGSNIAVFAYDGSTLRIGSSSYTTTIKGSSTTIDNSLTCRAIKTTHNTYDIGTSAARFKDGYFQGKLYAASGFFQSSDERLKDFFNPIEIDLDRLKNLRKNYFKFKDSDKMDIGVSAQEMRELYPEVVSETDSGYLNVDYSKLSVIALRGIDKLYEMYIELKEENRNLLKQLQSKN